MYRVGVGLAPLGLAVGLIMLLSPSPTLGVNIFFNYNSKEVTVKLYLKKARLICFDYSIK